MCLFVVVGLSACTNNSDGKKFKEEYESLNGEYRVKDGIKTSDKIRSIKIDENNPIVISSLDDIVKKMDNKETFIIYIGFPSCPWCRTVIPTALEKAKENKIDKIYYVNIKPGNETEDDLRDIYEKNEEGKIVLSHEGSKSYHEFLKKADNVLADYVHGDVNLKGTEFDGTKRVGAPNFIIIKSGKADTLITGISENQTDGYAKISKKMQSDMDKTFNSFFKKYNSYK